MRTTIDDDNYITEFCISTWSNGFDHIKKAIHVRKNTDKTVYQNMVLESYGYHSWGALMDKQKNYPDYNQIYNEIHIFMSEVYPNESKIQERDRLLKSLI